MKMNTWRQAGTEAKLLLIGIPVFIWTMLPIYHLALFAFSSKDEAMGGRLLPDHPTLPEVGRMRALRPRASAVRVGCGSACTNRSCPRATARLVGSSSGWWRPAMASELAISTNPE